METLIHDMNPWWETQVEETTIPREKYLTILESNLKNKDIILLTGLRRVGKTTILKQTIKKLLDQKVDPKTIIYLSLDAYPFNHKSIHDLIEKVKSINSIRSNQKLYLFLDEVTSKNSYAQELKTFYDTSKYKIFASSSSASLLKDNKAYLTGRTRTIIVEPLDFQEFLLFRKIEIKKSETYLYESQFEEYMKYGGMPEYVLTKDPEYLINLVDTIIHKDIIALNGLKNSAVIEDLFRLLCERVGKPISYNKLANILGASKDSIQQYIKYFLDTYLFFILEKKGKLNQRILEEKKLYCADVGIKNVTTGFRDLGAIFENLVYLKIKNNKPNFLKENGIEIDFCYKDTLLEVKYKREIKQKQKQLMKELNYKNKLIVDSYKYFLKN